MGDRELEERLIPLRGEQKGDYFVAHFVKYRRGMRHVVEITLGFGQRDGSVLIIRYLERADDGYGTLRRR